MKTNVGNTCDPALQQPVVSGSAFCSGLPCLKTPNCLRCNNTGWILPCNEKLAVMIDSSTLEGRYDNIKESETMIKCDCGR